MRDQDTHAGAGSPTRLRQLSLVEFVPLMALATALDAMSIDAMLPALPDIGRDLGVTGTTSLQLVVQLMFAGFAIGQLAGGPIADSYGRKAAFYLGLSIYVVGTLIAMLAPAYPLFLTGRVLQGLGASIPLIVLAALVRDQFEGAPMARIMSLIGGVFITVPIVAPLLGQGILLVGHWRLIFVMFLVLAVLVTIWFGIRQPETLPRENRTPLRLSSYLGAFSEALTHRVATSYMVAEGFVFGAFLPYLASAQHIFQDIYGQGAAFVFFFSSNAAALGVAFFANSALVMRFGMQRLTGGAMLCVVGLAIAMLAACLALGGNPPLALLSAYLMVTFLGVGFVFGNLNALAMEPLGHIAGVGAAVLGTVSTVIGIACGMLVGQAIEGTVLPLVIGFGAYFSIAFLIMLWAERGRTRLPASAQG